MATDTCTDGSTLLPSQPYLALHPHFGMLLGVADFEAEQAYHRGKMRLHNAWAHGWGVLWGLGVSVDVGKGEVAVAPGLALDGRGRELHNDLPQCVNVGRWFAEHRNDAGFEFTDNGSSGVGFDAHVRVRHQACLTSPVPALADSCGGGGGGGGASTAYSRVFETVVIELVPGLAPAPAHRHHLLRVLAGLDDAATDGDGNVLPADQEALDARVAIAAAAPADRVAMAAQALHHIAVLDTMADTTAEDEEDSEASLFPAAGPTSVVLADLPAVQLSLNADGSYALAAATVNPDVRAVLLPTATLQGLAGALLAALF
jgi:hypothetical protein